MASSDLHTYHFSRDEHWGLGGFEGVRLRGGTFEVAGGGTWHVLPVEPAADGLYAISFDPRGRLYWLSSGGKLMRHNGSEISAVGQLNAEDARHLVVGYERLWLADAKGVSLFDLRHLQLLRTIQIGHVVALARDYADAVWGLVRDPAGGDIWLRLDATGARQGPTVKLSGDTEALAGAFDLCQRRLLVLNESGVWWRDPCHDGWSRLLDLECLRCHFEPDRIAVDCESAFHLLDRTRNALWSFAPDGARLARRDIAKGPTAVTAFDTIAVACRSAILVLKPSPTGSASDHGRAAYADRLVRLDLSPDERERLDDLLGRFHVFKVKQPETRKASEGVVYVSAKADPKHAADFLEGVFRVVFDAPEDYELRVEQVRTEE